MEYLRSDEEDDKFKEIKEAVDSVTTLCFPDHLDTGARAAVQHGSKVPERVLRDFNSLLSKNTVMFVTVIRNPVHEDAMSPTKCGKILPLLDKLELNDEEALFFPVNIPSTADKTCVWLKGCPVLNDEQVPVSMSKMEWFIPEQQLKVNVDADPRQPMKLFRHVFILCESISSDKTLRLSDFYEWATAEEEVESTKDLDSSSGENDSAVKEPRIGAKEVTNVETTQSPSPFSSTEIPARPLTSNKRKAATSTPPISGKRQALASSRDVPSNITIAKDARAVPSSDIVTDGNLSKLILDYCAFYHKDRITHVDIVDFADIVKKALEKIGDQDPGTIWTQKQLACLHKQTPHPDLLLLVIRTISVFGLPINLLDRNIDYLYRYVCLKSKSPSAK